MTRTSDSLYEEEEITTPAIEKTTVVVEKTTGSKNKKHTKPKTNKVVDLSPLLNWKDSQTARLLGGNKLSNGSKFVKKLVDRLILKQEEDGETHYNTSVIAKTELGRLLEINTLSPFDHPELGKFNCLGGLWYYVLGGGLNEFRTLSGRACKTRSSKLTFDRIEGFKTIIAEALWVKVISNERLCQLLVESKNVPFTCYYVQGELNIPVEVQYNKWFSKSIHEIKTALIFNANLQKQVLEHNANNEDKISIDETRLKYPNFNFLSN